MAAKHDGKHARANMKMTHKNIARWMGGRPGRLFQEKKGPPTARAKAPPPAPPDAVEPPAEPAADATEEEKK